MTTSAWKVQNWRISVLCFTYLGSNFEADGDCEQDVKIRMAIAKSTFGKLMEIWKAEERSLQSSRN